MIRPFLLSIKTHVVGTNSDHTQTPVSIWHVVLPLLILVNIATFVPNIYTWTLVLCFFLFTPGYLFLRSITSHKWSTAELISFSVGFSVFLLMFIGLILNTLSVVGLNHPLTQVNILIALDILFIPLLFFNRHRQFTPSLPHIPPMSYRDLFLVCSATLLPFMAAGGAIMLNNGASNILTLITFAVIALLFVVALTSNQSARYYPYLLFMSALSILFTISLRGTGITGHDIQREWAVFQMTMSAEQWNIALFRDPYNACLSITILPTLLAKITGIPDAYIFKVVFQFIAALAIIPAYLFIKRLHGARDGLLTAFIFLSFPTFLNDMPMLNRQEIAFLFFGLIMLLILIAGANKKLQWLTVILMIALTFSHYSSSYVTIALLFITLFTHKFLRIITKPNDGSTHTKALPLLRFPIILVACICIFTWNFSITGTTKGLNSTFEKTIEGITGQSSNKNQATDVQYSIVSGAKKSPDDVLQAFTQPVAKNQLTVTNVPEETLPLTTIGQIINSIIPLNTVHSAIRGSIAKLLQVMLVIGCVLLWIRLKFHRYDVNDFYVLALCISSIILLVAVTILPQLSVDYGVLRLFQQLLYISALPIILSVIWLLSRWIKSPTTIYCICGIFFGAIFLHTSGFIPQVTGGYRAQLSLNNSGQTYDAYYIPTNERLGAEWIVSADTTKTAIAVDNYAQLRFDKNALQTIPLAAPFTPSTRAYVYHYKTPDTFIVNINSNLYSYKINRKNAYENMIYDNGGSQIGKLVKK